MEDIWFTSDTHFWHKNIIVIGKGRPWDTVEDMNEALIERWNALVNQGDRIYHLGDFSFGNKAKTMEVVRRLRGQIHVVRGNHDHVLDKAQVASMFASYQPYKEIKVEGQRLVLFHYPIHSWHDAHHGALHLHGHCHGGLADDGTKPRMDVGVDTHDYEPWHISEVLERLQPRLGWLPGDHHGA